MKKLISFLLVVILMFSFTSCKTISENTANSLTKDDKKALAAIATQNPVAIVSTPIDDVSENFKFCYEANGDCAKELIELVSGFEYTGQRCMCTAKHHIYVKGNEREFVFNLKFDPQNALESIEYGANAYIPMPQEAEKLTELLEKITTKENYRSVEGKESSVTLLNRDGNSFEWYSFKNADADRLIKLIHSIELTGPRLTDGVDYRIEGADVRLALNCEKPYVTSHEKSAYLTDAQLKEIKDILSRNCVKENIKDFPESKMPAFIKVLIDGDKRYTFVNEFSEFLINYVMLVDQYNPKSDCTCPKEYRIYSFFHQYEDSLITDYYIGFVDGIAHIQDFYGNQHFVMTESDSKYVKQIIDSQCTEQNIVKEKTED